MVKWRTSSQGCYALKYSETFIQCDHLTNNVTAFNTKTTFLMFVSHINRVKLYDIVCISVLLLCS